ncbi:MAG: hypothetical protein HFJ32_03200 [Clostridia bacterium]|nr:hypothetical protein [Clostridia bacterium]
MAEFTGKIGTPSDGFTLKVVYSYTQSVANNTSTLTATGYVKRNNSTYYPYNTTSSVVLKIDGKTYNFSPSYNLNTNNYVKICTKTVTITHGADGKKSVPISLKMDGKLSNYYPNGTISKTISLTTIPRATTPTLSATSIAMGSSVTITTNRASSNFTHTITYTFGATTGTIASSVGTSVPWVVPISLANQLPNTDSGTCTITCQTYNGSTLIGTKTVNLTLTVPSSVVPEISSIVISEAGSTPIDWGVYVQNKSKLKVVTTARGSYSSTIQSYKITGIDGNTYTSSNFTSSTLTQSGGKTVTVTVTDSRGRTATKTAAYTCIAYSNPTISKVTATRCNSDGTANEEGTYLKYTFKGAISSVNDKNTHVYKIGYKLTTASTYTYVTIPNDAYSIDKEDMVLSNVTFSENNSYHIQFYIGDYFTNSTIIKNVATGFTLMDFNSSGKSIAIGKVSEASNNQEMLEVAISTVFDKNVTLKTGGTALGTINSGSGFNRGSWNSPNQGIITQKTDNTNAQHSVMVGLSSTGNRIYGVDLLDSDSSPRMRLYSGNGYLEVLPTGATIGGCYILTTDNVVNNLTSTSSTAILSAYQGKLLNDTKVTQGAKSITNTTGGNSSYIILGNLLLCWGRVAIVPSAANTPTSKTITFPKKFSLSPAVIVNPQTGGPGTYVIGCSSNSTTTSNTKINLTRKDTTSTSVDWFAIGQA